MNIGKVFGDVLDMLKQSENKEANKTWLAYRIGEKPKTVMSKIQRDSFTAMDLIKYSYYLGINLNKLMEIVMKSETKRTSKDAAYTKTLFKSKNSNDRGIEIDPGEIVKVMRETKYLLDVVANNNLLILGASGSGKTTVMKELIYEYVEKMEKVLVLERWNEYVESMGIPCTYVELMADIPTEPVKVEIDYTKNNVTAISTEKLYRNNETDNIQLYIWFEKQIMKAIESGINKIVLSDEDDIVVMKAASIAGSYNIKYEKEGIKRKITVIAAKQNYFDIKSFEMMARCKQLYSCMHIMRTEMQEAKNYQYVFNMPEDLARQLNYQNPGEGIFISKGNYEYEYIRTVISAERYELYCTHWGKL